MNRYFLNLKRLAPGKKIREPRVKRHHKYPKGSLEREILSEQNFLGFFKLNLGELKLTLQETRFSERSVIQLNSRNMFFGSIQMTLDGLHINFWIVDSNISDTEIWENGKTSKTIFEELIQSRIDQLNKIHRRNKNEKYTYEIEYWVS